MTSRPPICLDLVTDKLISHEALTDAQKNDPALEKCCVSDEKS